MDKAFPFPHHIEILIVLEKIEIFIQSPQRDVIKLISCNHTGWTLPVMLFAKKIGWLNFSSWTYNCIEKTFLM